jgi:hypothetical protein
MIFGTDCGQLHCSPTRYSSSACSSLQVQLGELEVALDIATASAGTEAKWKQLGELAMSSGRLDVRPISG